MLGLSRRAPNSLIPLLLQSGADPNISDCLGRTALYWAGKERNVWAIQWLIAANVDVATPTGDPRRRNHVFQFVLDHFYRDADHSRWLGYLRSLHALALAGAKPVAHAPAFNRTKTQLNQVLNWFTPKREKFSNAQDNPTGKTQTENLREIRDIVHVLTDMLCNPLELRHLCRIQIRRLLGRDFRRKLLRLNVPLATQDYLRICKESDILQ